MRWARDATLLQDASFYSPVELSGPSVSSQQEKGLCVGSVFFEMLMWIATKTLNLVGISEWEWYEFYVVSGGTARCSAIGT
jgi:hypothetical protein